MNSTNQSKVCGGFSLVEALIAIAILAILAGVGTSALQGIQSAAREEKLRIDISDLNSAVRIYIASGGDLSQADTVDKVLTKLKSRASGERARRLTGLSSSVIDKRLTFRMQTEKEASGKVPRAHWNKDDMMFEILESGDAGVQSFHFSESAVPKTDLIDEDRAGAVLFAKESGWIWDYQDTSPDNRLGPTEIPLALATAAPVPPTAGPRHVSTPIGAKGPAPVLPPHVASLQPPVIGFSAPQFSPGTGTITVTLSDPNPPGTGEIRYELVPTFGGSGPSTAFATYAGPFSVHETIYPDGFGVRAYVRNVLPEYESSPLVSRYASSAGERGVFGGHLDLDTATTIAVIGRGGNEAHTHDYTGKYDVTQVDFFNILEDKQIEVQEAITNPAQKFKITVINGDLSPGMRLSITFRDLDGTTKTFVKGASDYDDYALEELSVYSLGDATDTRRLQSLLLQFNEDTILEGGVIPTNTGAVKSNILGKQNEWRNGALTVQLVAVKPDNSDGFTTDQSLTAQGGAHGPASSGLLWEGSLFWHWGGDSYHEEGNDYQPGTVASSGRGNNRNKDKEKSNNNNRNKDKIKDKDGDDHADDGAVDDDLGGWRGTTYLNDK